MSGRFEGKGVVVTGAAQGLGRAVAGAFAAEGGGVVLVDNEADVLSATLDSIRAGGGKVESVAGDVSRRADVKKAIDLAVEKFGHLDAAVQVAGIADFVPFLEFTDASWDRILDVNLRGAWYLAQEAGRVMVRDGVKGAIVLTASTNAFQPEAGGLAYNTSKAGQVAMMHTAALELSRNGIRVNASAPRIIQTRLSAFGLHVGAIPRMQERKIAAFFPDGDGETVPSTVDGVLYPIHPLQVTAVGMVVSDSPEPRGPGEGLLGGRSVGVYGGCGAAATTRPHGFTVQPDRPFVIKTNCREASDGVSH